MARSHLLIAALLLGPGLFAQEDCFNAIDDDGDGLVDLNDTIPCACHSGGGPLGLPSLIPNPSFEETDCIPTIYSELSCATGWEQATNGTSDYFNTAGYFPAILPPPVSGGSGMAGIYIMPYIKEYLGACLISPMIAGQQYGITFDVAAFAVDGLFENTVPIFFGNTHLTIFGRPDCAPFPVNTSDCPVAFGWTALGVVDYAPSESWSAVTITFTPGYDVAQIMVGGPCYVTPDYTSWNGYNPYFIVDDLRLLSDMPHGATIEVEGGFCTDDLRLVAHPDTLTGDYHWFQEGVALVGQVDTILDLSANGLGPGNYQFHFAVNDTVCSTTTFTVDPPEYPQPQFSVDTTNGCAPLAVDFTNTTLPELTGNCHWTFSNGTTSSACDTTVVFSDPGLYDATLTVTSTSGCLGDTTYTDLIEVFPLPMASFTVDTLEGCTPLPVQFTGTSTGDVQECAWQFGDGGTSNNCDPMHFFTQDGWWDVQLTVTSSNGCSDDSVMAQLIHAEHVPVLFPMADIAEGCRPLTVQFSDDAGPQDVGNCVWTFSNGETDSDCAPVAIFTDAGLYSAQLTVIAANGCMNDTTLTDWITVHDRPMPSFNAAPLSGCPPVEVAFTNTTSPVLTSQCHWTFGDGAIVEECDPFHNYTASGLYDVTLTVTSSDGCAGDTTASALVDVFGMPEAGFTYSPQNIDLFAPNVAFIDQSSANVVTWFWSFGADGTLGTSELEAPVLDLPAQVPGTYPVSLIVTTADGCIDTTSMILTVAGYNSIFAPDAFSPNDDGINESFFPVVEDDVPATRRLAIYDRWGELILSSTGADGAWDGTVGGLPAKPDVYVWQLFSRSAVDGEERMYLGHVMLLR